MLYRKYDEIFAECDQQDATFHNLSISVRRSACFSDGFSVPSRAQNRAYSVKYLSDLTAYAQFWARDGTEECLKHVEHLTEINKLWNVASCWLYSANMLATHGPVNVKQRNFIFNEHQINKISIQWQILSGHSSVYIHTYFPWWNTI